MQYEDAIMVVPEGLDSLGNPSGEPYLEGAAAIISAGKPYYDEELQQTVFLCRVRVPKGLAYRQLEQAVTMPGKAPANGPRGGPPNLPEQALSGITKFNTPEDFKGNRPDLWTRFNMDERTETYVDEEGVEQEMTIIPQVPVFL